MRSVFLLIVCLLAVGAVTAIAIALAASGKIHSSYGKLTHSRVMHWVGLFYPLLLGAALILYYGLPFTQLLRLPTVPNEQIQQESDLLYRALSQNDRKALAESGLAFDTQTLSYTGSRLEVSPERAVLLRVSAEPAPADTVILHYHRGAIAVGNIDLTSLQEDSPTFALHNDELKIIRAADSDRQEYCLTAWNTPLFLRQFPVEYAAISRHRADRSSAVLILQVPADVEISIDGESIAKGDFY